MLSVADAARAVGCEIAALAAERVALASARGRILADDARALRSLPGFDSSAMDGYAARSGDLPGELVLAGAVAAGQVRGEPVAGGQAVRILTGAPLPPGADTVVIQEDARVSGDRVALPAAHPGENVRRIGEDIATGELAVAAGTCLGAGELALLAALGHAEVSVYRTPRVALIATGDELVDVTTEPGPGQIVDSSAHMLAALVTECGGQATYLGIAKDDPAATTALLARALAYDAVITTGGVSVGDRDHVRGALAAAGVELALWKVAMKPGKPFAFGTRDGVPVFGLPGNPVSTFVAFELFVRPALLALQGAARTERARAPVRLAGGYTKPAGRAHYLRATVIRDGERLVAHPHAKQGSAILSSLIGCNALVEIAAEATEVRPESLVPALLLAPV